MADRCIRVGKRWANLPTWFPGNHLTDPSDRGAVQGDRLIFHAVKTEVKVTIEDPSVIEDKTPILEIEIGKCLAVTLREDAPDGKYSYKVERGHKGTVSGDPCGKYRCTNAYPPHKHEEEELDQGGKERERNHPTMVFIES